MKRGMKTLEKPDYAVRDEPEAVLPALYFHHSFTDNNDMRYPDVHHRVRNQGGFWKEFLSGQNGRGFENDMDGTSIGNPLMTALLLLIFLMSM